MGNQQQKGFQGKGNTLGTLATSTAPRTAPVRQQQQQQQQRKKNTAKGNRGAARRDPAAQNAARAAALEAAENRAKKFDNLVSKKNKKERKKREQEKFEKNFNSRGGTMNLGAQIISGGSMDPQAAPRSLGNHSNSLGFDPTKSVISSSTTGIAANNGISRTADNSVAASSSTDLNTSGVSMFSSTLADHHVAVDKNQLERVLKATQTSSISKRNENISRIKQGLQSNTGAKASLDQNISKIMQSSLIFAEAENRSSDLDMSLAFLTSAKDKPMALKCAETVLKIVKNIICNPTDTKYQKLMLKGKTVSEKILMVPGGADMLVSVGFTLLSERDAIAIKYDNIDDFEMAKLVSIVETIESFCGNLQEELRNERVDAVVTRDNQKFGTKQNA